MALPQRGVASHDNLSPIGTERFPENCASSPLPMSPGAAESSNLPSTLPNSLITAISTAGALHSPRPPFRSVPEIQKLPLGYSIQAFGWLRLGEGKAVRCARSRVPRRGEDLLGFSVTD